VKPVRTAVIPAAGLGTRFLPATKAMPKEMLPIIDRPVIQYVIEEALASGIDDIIIITGRGKRAIEDYFDDSPELEMHLKRERKVGLLKMIKNISSLADIHYIRQKEPKGLGDAILKAEKHVGNDPFAVLLGDDVIVNSIPCTHQLIKIFQKYRISTIAVEKVRKEKISNYGIIRGKALHSGLYLIEDIIEKPQIQKAPSDLGVIGRYILIPEIFEYLKKITPGYGGEIQLTDAIRLMSQKKNVYAYRFDGKRYDTGDKVDYVKTIIDFALRNSETKDDIRMYLEEILKDQCNKM